MMRPRKSMPAALAAILLASVLAAAPTAAAPNGPNSPQGPSPRPRNGDPDVPEWSSRTFRPDHVEVAAHATLWSYLRALIARDEV